MARYIELYQHFDFSVIHVFLEDLNNITEVNEQLGMAKGDALQWNDKASDAQKQAVFERLLAKIYRKLDRQNIINA